MECQFFDINKNNPIHCNIDITENSTLYHYTDFRGITGILNSGCLWVSRSDALNDLAEISYIKTVLKAVCEIIKSDFDEYKNMKFDVHGTLLDNIIKYVEFLCNSSEKSDYEIYILSLTENMDSLALFSNYSTMDGYNIGIDLNELIPKSRIFFSYKGCSVTTGNVIYNFEKQITIIVEDIMNLYNSVYDRLMEINAKANQSLYNKIFNDIMQILLIKTTIYSLFFKHFTFFHEEEYRFAFIVPKDIEGNIVKYKDEVSKNGPYIEFYPKEMFPLESIRLSPKNKNEGEIKEILSILKLKNYSQVKIYNSIIPLR